MPISLDELSSEVSEPLEVNIGTEAQPKIVTVVYRPHAMTPALEDKIYAVAQRSQIGGVYRMMLLEALESWDIQGTLPALPYPEIDPNSAGSDYIARKRQDVDNENDQRTTPHILPITAEAMSLVPTGILEKIVVAIQGAQSPKKPTSNTSRGSFGAQPAAPYQRGTA